MNMGQIKKIAKERGVKVGKLKKVDLVRAIQGQEKNPQCFCTGCVQTCGELDCLWREDCR